MSGRIQQCRCSESPPLQDQAHTCVHQSHAHERASVRLRPSLVSVVYCQVPDTVSCKSKQVRFVFLVPVLAGGGRPCRRAAANPCTFAQGGLCAAVLMRLCSTEQKSRGDFESEVRLGLLAPKPTPHTRQCISGAGQLVLTTWVEACPGILGTPPPRVSSRACVCTSPVSLLPTWRG